MQNSNQSAPASAPFCKPAAPLSRAREDVAYQAVTIVAILLLLGSLWVF